MKSKGVLTVFVLTVMLSVFGMAEVWAQARPGTKPPIITHSFALEKGIYGAVWRIYIEAEDPDGDMLKIAQVVDMVGYGHYPTGWNFLKPQYGGHLKGYLQWNTFSSKAAYLPEWTQITLRISIIDKAGNESNEVIFPYTFEMGGPNPDRLQPPPPFDQPGLPRIGYISVDLVNPWMDGRGQKDD